MPKFSPVRNGRQAISDESLEGIKREGLLHSGANKVLPNEENAPEVEKNLESTFDAETENIILPKTLKSQRHLPLRPKGNEILGSSEKVDDASA